MTVVVKAQPKDEIKVVAKALVESESFVKKQFGDMADFDNSQVEAIANVSPSTRKRDRDNIKLVVEWLGLSFSTENRETAKGTERNRFGYWSRDAVVLYRAYRQVMARFNCPRDYKRNTNYWLPLIAKEYGSK